MGSERHPCDRASHGATLQLPDVRPFSEVPGNAKSRLSQRPFIEELPEILEERGLSLREIARQAGVDPGHLNRVLRRADYKTPSAKLCERVAVTLGLPADYWPEYREHVIVSRVRADPELRETLYKRITSRSGQRS